MSESKPPRLKKSLKARVLLDAGAFYESKMSESKPPHLTKSSKSRVLLDAGAFYEPKMGTKIGIYKQKCSISWFLFIFEGKSA